MTARYTRPGQLCPAGARSTLPSLVNCAQLEPAQCSPGAYDVQRYITTLSHVLRDTSGDDFASETSTFFADFVYTHLSLLDLEGRDGS